MITCYVARSMSNRVASEVVREAQSDKELLENLGFIVLCPVEKEHIQSSDKIICASKQEMDLHWAEDKRLIREANVVFIMSPNVGSLGCIREYGYARFHLWKKVITVFPRMPAEGAVCYYEDDTVTDSLLKGAINALMSHGTWWKRFKWRVGVYRRSWIKAVWYRFQEWWR